MRKPFGSDDDDDDDMEHSADLLRTQRFSKTDTFGSKDLKATFTRPKPNEMSNMNLKLDTIHDDEDSLNDSDEDLNTKTGRSTSSGTSSQRTPKPKERTFLKSKDGAKPRVPPRRTDYDEDDDRNVFGQSTIKPSPRHHITTLREDEENNQNFMKGFLNEKKRQSPTDFLGTNQKTDFRKNSRQFSTDREIDRKRRDSDNDDDDDEEELSISAKQTKANGFTKSRHSSTTNDRPQSRKNSSKSRDDSDKSDDNDELRRLSDRQDFRNHRSSNHELEQTVPREIDTTANQHQLPSSRPSSASRKEVEPVRRSSYCEEQESIIPPVIHQQSQSRPTSAKSNTTRQQTQSAIDNVTSANMPPLLDPLTSNNEALATALQPSLPPPPPPRPSARLPPRPKQTSTTSGGIHKKPQFKVPSRYKEITSRVDTGRQPASEINLTASIQRALEKELKSQTLPRPQSARARTHSANSDNNTTRQRRRSSSGYEHVKPRVNTNLSINFDELNTSQMHAESSQTIKDGVYLEWLKTKEDQRKENKVLTKRWEEEKTKRIDKSTIERRVQQNLQNLDRWRHEKEEQIRKKKQEELALKQEQEENARQEQLQKRKNAKDGFDNWKQQKDEKNHDKIDEERNKKTEIEKRQEDKQNRILEAAKAFKRWEDKKAQQIKKNQETKKTDREEQLKKLRENEETKFVSAQDAYEKWLNNKEKDGPDDKMNTQRRNSLSTKQQQVPFLPGGAQKNTGKIRHAVW
ncbi:hypothetical protein I4U23_000707 [Adineta vaga]|nr:hypothetical protein I4U23_000707 [Adineta vaga]